MPEPTPRKGKRRGTDPLETAATIVSGLLILAIAAFLVREIVRGETPAAFEVRLGAVGAAGATRQLPVEVRNTGGRAAAAVRVVVESGDGRPAGELTLDWIPARSTRRGWLVLREAPSAPLTARVESYRPP